MADMKSTPNCAIGQSNRFKEAVCVEAERIFDSCSDKDCLEDLHVLFTSGAQSVIDSSEIIKCRSAEVVDTTLSVEPVPFNRGFFAVDVTFYFVENFSCYASPVAIPVNVRGLAYHTKKVVLYGGDGDVKTFYSNFTAPESDSAPVVCLKAVDPVVLNSRVSDCAPPYIEPVGRIPDSVTALFDGVIITNPDPSHKTVLVSLGLFTIIALQRSVQLMIPAYDYVLPEKDCVTPFAAENPCEIFRSIRFPVNEFFPDDLNKTARSNNGCR